MTTRLASPPQKAHTSFTLSLGLVQFPLRVLSGIESTRVERHEFVAGDINHPVGRKAYDKATGDAVEQDQVTRMALASDGVTWVLLGDDEIEAATMPKGVAEVVAFVPVNKLHASYATGAIDQVRAKTSAMNAAQKRAAEQAFGLFLAGLKARKVVALVKVALRGPAAYRAITPEGDFIALYAADALRAPAALPAVILSDREKDLMGQLIDSYGVGTPTITDETAVAVQKYVDAKSKGVAAPVASVPDMASDLFAALSASIDANKRGAA